MTISDGGPRVKGDAPTTETSLHLDDGAIHVSQDGPRDAPALVLIHGTAASVRTWDLLVPLLTGSHRVTRVDLLGCGRSTKPVGASYAVSDQGRRVGEALDRLGVEHAVVVGHSGGGAVATALADQRPGLVTALVLINSGPSMDALIAPEESGGGRPAQWPPTDEQIRQLASTGLSADYQIPREVVDELRDTPFEVFVAVRQATGDYLEQRPLPERLAPLGKPLLVIFGADDRRWRSSSAADYRVVPGATVELLPGLGHTPILEDPASTAEPLLAFAAIHAAPDR